MLSIYSRPSVMASISHVCDVKTWREAIIPCRKLAEAKQGVLVYDIAGTLRRDGFSSGKPTKRRGAKKAGYRVKRVSVLTLITRALAKSQAAKRSK